jgi:hypothetical protein
VTAVCYRLREKGIAKNGDRHLLCEAPGGPLRGKRCPSQFFRHLSRVSLSAFLQHLESTYRPIASQSVSPDTNRDRA